MKGFCKCGCGSPTGIAQHNNKKRGYVKGEPLLYLRGHGTRQPRVEWVGELPLCACGCGQRVELSKVTDRTRGRIIGQPNLYARGHYDRSVPPPKNERRGYKTVCHIWQGQITKAGYARRDAADGTVLAHRQIYIAAHGPIGDGMHVHHLCEQADCVRLDHLEAQSRSAHIRGHRGLTPEKYDQICEAIRSGGETQAAIARRFGVTKPYIWELRRSLLA